MELFTLVVLSVTLCSGSMIFGYLLGWFWESLS